MSPYLPWVERQARLRLEGAAISPLASALPQADDAAPLALIFAPHPDDEVIVGALPLRLRRELGFRITDVAVTLGSRADRRAPRLRELRAACATLGFGLINPEPSGLERITPQGQRDDPANWDRATALLAVTIEQGAPRAIFLPHAADWNQTHIGVHRLVTEAMARVPALACWVIETEFWGAMPAPNLMIESSPADVADLVNALALHDGEVARNPYHLRLPAWMSDNVRRGAELVGGQGGLAPDFGFATLYRLRAWQNGGFDASAPPGRGIAAAAPLDTLLPPWK